MWSELFSFDSWFIRQSMPLFRYATYSSDLHMPFPSSSEIFATSVPLQRVVFMTMLSAGSSVSFAMYVPMPNATFARPLKWR